MRTFMPPWPFLLIIIIATLAIVTYQTYNAYQEKKYQKSLEESIATFQLMEAIINSELVSTTSQSLNYSLHRKDTQLRTTTGVK